MKKSYLAIKRAADILFTIILMAALSPLFLIVSILILVSMPGPVIFRQERVGKSKKVFLIFKFRTMKVDKVAEATLDFSKDKERVTSLGRFLRRSKIDELPQLLNVLLNDMSLVGPRPTIMSQVEQYNELQLKRLLVKPGMTGLAQVNGNATITWEKRINFDIEYVERASFLLDLQILLKTIAIVLFGEEIFKKR